MVIGTGVSFWQRILGVVLMAGLFFGFGPQGIPSVSAAPAKESVSLDALKELLDDAVTAKACVLYDPLEQKILFSRHSRESLPPASLTKILTGITVIENTPDLDRVVTIRRNIRIGNGAVTVGLNKGDRVSIRDLLDAAMLHSANDACVALAEACAGSEKAFLTLMNRTARRIGATESHFANTNGMPKEGHRTTARDLALIAAHAMRNPVFRRIVGQQRAAVTIHTERKSKVCRRSIGAFPVAKEPEAGHRIPYTRNFHVKNRHRLVGRYNGITGIKTGYTHAAGRCLATSFVSHGREVIAVVLNSRDVEKDTLYLLGYQKDVARQERQQILARR